MSGDPGDEVLARLLAVLKTVDGPAAVLDNQRVASDSELPVLILVDGEADVDERDHRPGRPTIAPVRMTARPIVVIVVGGEPGQIRAKRKTLKRRIVDAVLKDSKLIELTGVDPSGAIRFLGTATGQRQGREIYGDMQIDFEFGYVLRPAEL